MPKSSRSLFAACSLLCLIAAGIAGAQTGTHSGPMENMALAGQWAAFEAVPPCVLCMDHTVFEDIQGIRQNLVWSKSTPYSPVWALNLVNTLNATGNLIELKSGQTVGTLSSKFKVDKDGVSEIAGTLTLGTNGAIPGLLVLNGTTSGAVLLQPPASSAGWNFNLPTTAGSAGQVLTSQGGGSTAMTWTTAAGGGNVSNTGTPTSGQLATWTSATVIQGVTALPATNFPALTGDVTTSAGALATTIAANAVTTAKVADGNITKAKIENVAADKLLGRGNGGGAGAPQEITLGTNLSMTGSTLNAAGGGGATLVRLASDVVMPSVSATYNDVTGLSFTPEANKDYLIEFAILYTGNTTTVGVDFAVNGPASPTSISCMGRFPTALNAVTDSVQQAYDSGLITTGQPAGTWPGTLTCLFRNGATSSPFILRHKLETGTAAVNTIKAGSVLRYTLLN